MPWNIPMRDSNHLRPDIPPRNASESRVLAFNGPPSRTPLRENRASAMVFEDQVSRTLKSELDRLAPSDASLLLIGETGTGKEQVARYVHEQSKRRNGPFVAVNCGALPETLVEAELFGYEKGAFTGALKAQVGWFEAANRGTLLLDEVGDLAPHLQVKLLRVLQEREVVRLGARNPIDVDVRIMASTNVDLEAAIVVGEFRQDLYYRLAVASVVLPPLRHRIGDISVLADHFLAIYRERVGRPELTFAEAVRATLGAHSWPGNIRELENVIHNAVLLAKGPVIQASELKLSRVTNAASPSWTDEYSQLIERLLAAEEPNLFARVTEQLVRTAFEWSGRNQVRAAQRLGLTRNSLRTELARLGIIPGRGTRKPISSKDSEGPN
jgi:transcriptional regulator with PAS, ATPase and Fis domain